MTDAPAPSASAPFVPVVAEPTNRRQRDKAVTRATVLQAARDLFQQVGYEAATIRAIAVRANRSTGAVFAHWPDKAAVYREVHGHEALSPEQGAALLGAVRRLMGVRPANWADDDDPEQVLAWTLADRAVALAEGRIVETPRHGAA